MLWGDTGVPSRLRGLLAQACCEAGFPASPAAQQMAMQTRRMHIPASASSSSLI